jgi:hypothetical protein
MIGYRDFIPRVLVKERWFKKATYETFDDALAAANSWIAEESVKVVNIETVVLPNIRDLDERGSKDAELTAWDRETSWYQVIRVWYEK